MPENIVIFISVSSASVCFVRLLLKVMFCSVSVNTH